MASAKNQVITSENLALLRLTESSSRSGLPIAFSPDGIHIAQEVCQEILKESTGLAWKGVVEIWSRSGEPSRLLPSTCFLALDLGNIRQLAYSPTGSHLVYTDHYGLYLYDTSQYDLVWKRSYDGEACPSPSPQYVQDSAGSRNPVLLFGGFEDVFRVGLDLHNEANRVPLEGFARYSSDIRFSSSGDMVAAWDTGRRAPQPTTLGIWNLHSGKRDLLLTSGDDESVDAVAFHPLQPLIAVARGSTITIYKLPEGKRCAEIRLPKRSTCEALDFVTDGTLLAVNYITSVENGWWDGEPDWSLVFQAELWDWEWGARLWGIRPSGDRVGIAVSPDGREMAAVTSEGTEFWTVPAGTRELGESRFLPEYDSQGNPFDHPMYMEDD